MSLGHQEFWSVESAEPAARFWLWVILGLALVLRMLLLVLTFVHDPTMQATHSPDTTQYLALAAGLASSGTFTFDGAPELLRTPGYPLFLALGVRVGHPELVAVLLQALLGVLTTYLVYDVARVLFRSPQCGLLAAALYAVEPVTLLYTSRVLTEALFAALIVGSMSLLVRTVERPDARLIAASALILAASAYVRPISYYLPLILAPVLFLLVWARSAWIGRKRALIALFLVLAMGPQLLWQARNYVQTGYSGFTAIVDLNLQNWLGAAVVADRERISLAEAQSRLGKEFDRNVDKDWSPAKRYRAIGTAGLQIIREDPIRFAKIFVRGIVINLIDPGGTMWLRHFDLLPSRTIRLEDLIYAKGPVAGLKAIVETIPSWLFVNLSLGLFAVLLLGGSALALVVGPMHREQAVLLLVVLMAYFLILAGGLNSSRLRHPSIPWMCMLTAYGLLALDAWRRGRRASVHA